MDNFKCLSAHICENMNNKEANVFIFIFIDACETLRKELSKSLKIAKKFQEELKLANLKKEELIVRLVEFLRNQFSSYDKKVKSLKQKLAELETKLENLFLFPLSLKLIMFIFVLLREIINKRIILLG